LHLDRVSLEVAMQRHTIAMREPPFLTLSRRLGPAGLALRRVAAVVAAMGFAIYLVALSRFSTPR